MSKSRNIVLLLSFCLLISSSVYTPAASAADTKLTGLVKRLNANGNLWKINEFASSQMGAQSRQRLGLYQQPTVILDCNLRMSGTWLFVYKDTNLGYKAAASNYFVRANYYDFEMLIDPKTNYVVLVHTSMGGNQTCLNSAYKVLSYISD